MNLSSENILDPEINILFTSVGRRGYLLNWFRDSGLFGKILAINSESCTGFTAADHWEVVPETTNEMFEKRLVGIVEKYHVKLVIPLTDLDALVISQLSATLSEKGVTFFGASFTDIKRMVDKGAWPELLAANGFPTARTYLSIDQALDALDSKTVSFPLVIKPRVGTSSRSIEIVRSTNELRPKYERASESTEWEAIEELGGIPADQRVVIQELVPGTEYGWDLLADFSGKYEGFLARRKVSMRAGETDIAITLPNFVVDFSMRQLSKILGVRGLVDVDFVRDSSGAQAILDINPRIGGGYPFSHMAGANLPRYIRNWLDGKVADVSPEDIIERQFGKEVSLTEVPTSSPRQLNRPPLTWS